MSSKASHEWYCTWLVAEVQIKTQLLQDDLLLRLAIFGNVQGSMSNGVPVPKKQTSIAGISFKLVISKAKVKRQAVSSKKVGNGSEGQNLDIMIYIYIYSVLIAGHHLRKSSKWVWAWGLGQQLSNN